MPGKVSFFSTLEREFFFSAMTTKHTPLNTRAGAGAGAGTGTGAGAGAGAAAIPGDDFQRPPPVVAMGHGPMLMSSDQFDRLIDTCRAPAAAAGTAEDDFPNVSSVAVKLPTFWMHDPDLWFLQTEAVFASRNPPVTRDATKFNHVVTALPSEALNSIKNVIRLAPNAPDRYLQLKNILTLTYGKTPAEKYVELIQFASAKEPILDQKPSTLLLYIQDLSGDSKEAFERQVLLGRLPESVQTALANSTAPNNQEFAKEANRAMESYLLAQKSSASTVASVAPQNSSIPEVNEVAAVAYRPNSRQPQGTQRPASFLCYAHSRYGVQALSLIHI